MRAWPYFLQALTPLVVDQGLAEVTVIRGCTIRFNKVDGFIRVYDGTRYLVLFVSENHRLLDKSIFFWLAFESYFFHGQI